MASKNSKRPWPDSKTAWPNDSIQTITARCRGLLWVAAHRVRRGHRGCDLRSSARGVWDNDAARYLRSSIGLCFGKPTRVRNAPGVGRRHRGDLLLGETLHLFDAAIILYAGDREGNRTTQTGRIGSDANHSPEKRAVTDAQLTGPVAAEAGAATLLSQKATVVPAQIPSENVATRTRGQATRLRTEPATRVIGIAAGLGILTTRFP